MTVKKYGCIFALAAFSAVFVIENSTAGYHHNPNAGARGPHEQMPEHQQDPRGTTGQPNHGARQGYAPQRYIDRGQGGAAQTPHDTPYGQQTHQPGGYGPPYETYGTTPPTNAHGQQTHQAGGYGPPYETYGTTPPTNAHGQQTHQAGGYGPQYGAFGTTPPTNANEQQAHQAGGYGPQYGAFGTTPPTNAHGQQTHQAGEYGPPHWAYGGAARPDYTGRNANAAVGYFELAADRAQTNEPNDPGQQGHAQQGYTWNYGSGTPTSYPTNPRSGQYTRPGEAQGPQPPAGTGYGQPESGQHADGRPNPAPDTVKAPTNKLSERLILQLPDLIKLSTEAMADKDNKARPSAWAKTVMIIVRNKTEFNNLVAQLNQTKQGALTMKLIVVGKQCRVTKEDVKQLKGAIRKQWPGGCPMMVFADEVETFLREEGTVERAIFWTD